MIGPSNTFYDLISQLGEDHERDLLHDDTVLLPTRETIARETTAALGQCGLVKMRDELVGQYLLRPLYEGGRVVGRTRLGRTHLYTLAEPDEILAAVRAHIAWIAEKHGPGSVWFLCEPVHVITDDGRMCFDRAGGKLYARVRTLYGHEKQAVPG